MAVADRLASAALISLVRFWTKRSPTRIAGTSIAAITSINSRVRRLIGASFRAQIARSVAKIRSEFTCEAAVLEYRAADPLGRLKFTREEQGSGVFRVLPVRNCDRVGTTLRRRAACGVPIPVLRCALRRAGKNNLLLARLAGEEREKQSPCVPALTEINILCFAALPQCFQN